MRNAEPIIETSGSGIPVAESDGSPGARSESIAGTGVPTGTLPGTGVLVKAGEATCPGSRPEKSALEVLAGAGAALALSTTGGGNVALNSPAVVTPFAWPGDVFGADGRRGEVLRFSSVNTVSDSGSRLVGCVPAVFRGTGFRRAGAGAATSNETSGGPVGAPEGKDASGERGPPADTVARARRAAGALAAGALAADAFAADALAADALAAGALAADGGVGSALAAASIEEPDFREGLLRRVASGSPIDSFTLLLMVGVLPLELDAV